MAVGIEGRMAAQLDRERVWGQTDDEKFNREIARPWKESAFSEYDFVGRSYSRAEVESDLKKVGEIKKSPAYVRERGSEAVALEYVLMEGVKVHGWFGDSVQSVQKTSEYDDVMNGTDFVVIFHNEDTDEFVYLAIDATTSADQSVLWRKGERTFEKLAAKKMTEIKYFEDPDKNMEKVEMPRIVLSLSPERTVALQKLMTGTSNLAEDAREKFEFISSAENQLIKFINYILIREGFLGEGRDLKNFGEFLEFTSRHGDDLDEKTRKIVEAHADVLEFITLAAPKPKSVH
ncbi:hypothetical protein KKD80_00450 [Patescibacteria group bacterium]|nr:hypothetical protein [Patescibacteria group bacterium]